MAEPTKGPWTVVPRPWDDTGMIVVSGSGDPHQGKVVCRTDEGRWNEHTNADLGEWRANAALIAAAPPMRDALKLGGINNTLTPDGPSFLRHIANVLAEYHRIHHSNDDIAALRRKADAEEAALTAAEGDAHRVQCPCGYIENSEDWVPKSTLATALDLLRAAAPKCEWCGSVATWYVASNRASPVAHWLCDEHREVNCTWKPLWEYDLGRRIAAFLADPPAPEKERET